MAEVNVGKLDKKQLREHCDKLGVTWDKRTDDEEALRKKLKAHLSVVTGEKSGTAFDVTKRGPVATITDPKTKKTVTRVMECFGWLYAPIYSPNDQKMVKLCTTECPHGKLCKAFTEKADKVIKELDAEMDAEAEVADVTADDIKLAEKAGKTKSEKKGKSEATLTKGEKRKSAIEEDTEVEVAFDLDWALSVDDADFRKFYKACAKKWSEGDKCKVSDVLDVLLEKLGLGEDERDTALADLIPEFIAEGQFKRVD